MAESHSSSTETDEAMLLIANVNQLFPHELHLAKFEQGKRRTTPLYEAALSLPCRKDSLIKLFLDAGSNVGLRNEGGETALHGAVKVGNKRAVRTLLDRGADIDATIQPKKEFELKTQPDDNAQPGWTALHQAAYCGSEMMVRLLFERGANMSIQDDLGRTPLDVAISKRRQGPLWALLECGAAEHRDKAWEMDTTNKGLLWHGDVLPDWVFTSASLKFEPEPVLIVLERLTVKSSPLENVCAEPRICTGCQTLKETDPKKYEEKDRNVSRWRGKASFDTPFRKRCLLCRKVIAGLEPSYPVSSASNLGQINVQEQDDVNLLDFFCLSLDRKKHRFPQSEPVDIIYEASNTYSPNSGANTITEELASLLDHTERFQDADTGSESAFVLATYWLHTCLTRHRNCILAADGGMPFLPTRVIDVGSQDAKQPPYIHVSEGERGLYCTLSYRWGTSKFFTTSRDTLKDLQNKIPVESLPKTVQDAITITRRFGVRYLWVDALCIIQDDKSDWNREASRMAGVYRNALFTIAAGEQPSEEHGIFRKRHHIPRPWRREQSPDAMPGYFDYSHPFYSFSSNARPRPPGELDSRGWCLQEQLLSPRILSYVDGELFWDCLSLSGSESFPGGNSSVKYSKEKIFTDTDMQLFKSTLLRISKVPEEGGKENVYKLWGKLVEAFMHRSLTKETDRLVAIQGISDAVARFVNDELLVGVWKNSFARHLLWWVDTITEVHRYACRPKSFKAASWSWASVIGNITYKQIGLHRSPDDDKEDLGTIGGSFTPTITVRDIHVETDTANAQVAGRVTLEGSLIRVFTREDEGKWVFYSGWRHLHYHGRRVFLSPGAASPSSNPQADGRKTDETGQDPFEGVPKEFANWLCQSLILPDRQMDCWEPWYPDTEDDFPSELFCLLVAVEKNNQLCLCMVPTGIGENEYRRIGVCSWYLGHADVSLNGLGSLRTISIV